ncbi:MAG: rod shape-determining protein MreC [Gemmatimonadota bacterium]
MAYLHATRRRRGRADLVLFLALLGVGGLVSALSPAQQAVLASGVRGSVLFPFLELHRASEERAWLQRRAAELRAERDSLVAELTRQRALIGQARDLRGVFGLGVPAVGAVLPAEVVPGRPRIGDSNVFVLRATGLDQVEVPAGVFTGRGLVGVVRELHATGARGQFWTHPDFRVSVETSDGSISGIVRPYARDGGLPAMLLEGAPYQDEIPPGTRLVTTGIAGTYPPGIQVGTVREQAEGEAGWMKRYVVEPAVRPEHADVVLVWRRPDLGS